MRQMLPVDGNAGQAKKVNVDVHDVGTRSPQQVRSCQHGVTHVICYSCYSHTHVTLRG